MQLKKKVELEIQLVISHSCGTIHVEKNSKMYVLVPQSSYVIVQSQKWKYQNLPFAAVHLITHNTDTNIECGHRLECI